MKIVLRYIASTQKNYLSSVTKYFYFVTLHLWCPAPYLHAPVERLEWHARTALAAGEARREVLSEAAHDDPGDLTPHGGREVVEHADMAVVCLDVTLQRRPLRVHHGGPRLIDLSSSEQELTQRQIHALRVSRSESIFQLIGHRKKSITYLILMKIQSRQSIGIDF